MAFNTATLTGTYQTFDGNPASGTVEIIPNSRVLIDSEGDVILSGRVKVALDEAGSFTATLPATDDETVEPAIGRQYTVVAKLRHTHLAAVTGIELAAGETVDMADVTSATETAAALSVWLTEDEFTAVVDRVAALEESPGGVTTVNGESGAVTLSAADVGADPAGAAAEAEAAALAADEAKLDVADADASYVRAGQTGLVLDVTSAPYNTDNTGATDASADIQAAMDATSLAGGGTVFLPQGTYKIGTALVPKDYVWVMGAGRLRTELRPQGGQSAMRDLRTAADPLKGFSVTDLTIDGADQTLNAGVYYAGTKGIFFQYGEDCLFQNLHIKNTAASGLGIDFLNRVKIDFVDATNCGRLNPGGEAGGAGIGIGSGGEWQVESFHVSNCTLVGNTNYGIFVERQDWVTPSYGGTISDCYAEGNGAGFGDAGMAFLHLTGCTAAGNVGPGFEIHPGTVGASLPGRHGTIVGCSAHQNGTDGVLYTNEGDKSGVSGYQIIGGTFTANGRDGIRFESATAPVYGWTINGAEVSGNDECGIRFRSTGGGLLRELAITGCNILNNGQDAAAANGHGILFESNVSVGQVSGNVIADNQASKTQDYGVLVGAGVALTAVSVSGNTIINNAVAQVGTASGSALSYGSAFRDNVGYNDTFGIEPLTVAPTGPLNYTAGNVPTEMYVIGGTVTTIKVNDVTVHTATNVTLRLKPRDVVAIAYSAPMIAVKIRKF